MNQNFFSQVSYNHIICFFFPVRKKNHEKSPCLCEESSSRPTHPSPGIADDQRSPCVCSSATPPPLINGHRSLHKFIDAHHPFPGKTLMTNVHPASAQAPPHPPPPHLISGHCSLHNFTKTQDPFPGKAADDQHAPCIC